MRVDFEHVLLARAVLAQINHYSFDDIEWYEHGEPVIVPGKIADDWRFVGLANMDFPEVAKTENGVVQTIWEESEPTDA